MSNHNYKQRQPEKQHDGGFEQAAGSSRLFGDIQSNENAFESARTSKRRTIQRNEHNSSRNQNADLNESLLRETANPYDPLEGPSLNAYVMQQQASRLNNDGANTLTNSSHNRKFNGPAAMFHSPALTQDRLNVQPHGLLGSGQQRNMRAAPYGVATPDISDNLLPKVRTLDYQRGPLTGDLSSQMTATDHSRKIHLTATLHQERTLANTHTVSAAEEASDEGNLEKATAVWMKNSLRADNTFKASQSKVQMSMPLVSIAESRFPGAGQRAIRDQQFRPSLARKNLKNAKSSLGIAGGKSSGANTAHYSTSLSATGTNHNSVTRVNLEKVHKGGVSSYIYHTTSLPTANRLVDRQQLEEFVDVNTNMLIRDGGLNGSDKEGEIPSVGRSVSSLGLKGAFMHMSGADPDRIDEPGRVHKSPFAIYSRLKAGSKVPVSVGGREVVIKTVEKSSDDRLLAFLNTKLANTRKQMNNSALLEQDSKKTKTIPAEDFEAKRRQATSKQETTPIEEMTHYVPTRSEADLRAHRSLNPTCGASSFAQQSAAAKKTRRYLQRELANQQSDQLANVQVTLGKVGGGTAYTSLQSLPQASFLGSAVMSGGDVDGARTGFASKDKSESMARFSFTKQQMVPGGASNDQRSLKELLKEKSQKDGVNQDLQNQMSTPALPDIIEAGRSRRPADLGKGADPTHVTVGNVIASDPSQNQHSSPGLKSHNEETHAQHEGSEAAMYFGASSFAQLNMIGVGANNDLQQSSLDNSKLAQFASHQTSQQQADSSAGATLLQLSARGNADPRDSEGTANAGDISHARPSIADSKFGTQVNIKMPREGSTQTPPKGSIEREELLTEDVTDYQADDAVAVKWRAPKGDSIFHKLRQRDERSLYSEKFKQQLRNEQASLANQLVGQREERAQKMASVHREHERRERIAERSRAKFNIRQSKDYESQRASEPARSLSLHESPTLKNIDTANVSGSIPKQTEEAPSANNGKGHTPAAVSSQSLRPTIIGTGQMHVRNNERQDATFSSGLVSNPLAEPRLDLASAQIHRTPAAGVDSQAPQKKPRYAPSERPANLTNENSESFRARNEAEVDAALAMKRGSKDSFVSRVMLTSGENNLLQKMLASGEATVASRQMQRTPYKMSNMGTIPRGSLAEHAQNHYLQQPLMIKPLIQSKNSGSFSPNRPSDPMNEKLLQEYRQNQPASFGKTSDFSDIYKMAAIQNRSHSIEPVRRSDQQRASHDIIKLTPHESDTEFQVHTTLPEKPDVDHYTGPSIFNLGYQASEESLMQAVANKKTSVQVIADKHLQKSLYQRGDKKALYGYNLIPQAGALEQNEKREVANKDLAQSLTPPKFSKMPTGNVDRFNVKKQKQLEAGALGNLSVDRPREIVQVIKKITTQVSSPAPGALLGSVKVSNQNLKPVMRQPSIHQGNSEQESAREGYLKQNIYNASASTLNPLMTSKNKFNSTMNAESSNKSKAVKQDETPTTSFVGNRTGFAATLKNVPDGSQNSSVAMFFNGVALKSGSEFGAIPEAGTTTEMTRDVLGDRSTLNRDADASRNTQEAYFGDPSRANITNQQTKTFMKEHLTFGGNQSPDGKREKEEIHIDIQPQSSKRLSRAGEKAELDTKVTVTATEEQERLMADQAGAGGSNEASPVQLVRDDNVIDDMDMTMAQINAKTARGGDSYALKEVHREAAAFDKKQKKLLSRVSSKKEPLKPPDNEEDAPDQQVFNGTRTLTPRETGEFARASKPKDAGLLNLDSIKNLEETDGGSLASTVNRRTIDGRKTTQQDVRRHGSHDDAASAREMPAPQIKPPVPQVHDLDAQGRLMESFRSTAMISESYLADTRYLQPQFDKVKTTAVDQAETSDASPTRFKPNDTSKRESTVTSPIFKGSIRAAGVDKLIMDSVYAYQDQYRQYKAEEKQRSWLFGKLLNGQLQLEDLDPMTGYLSVTGKNPSSTLHKVRPVANKNKASLSNKMKDKAYAKVENAHVGPSTRQTLRAAQKVINVLRSNQHTQIMKEVEQRSRFASNNNSRRTMSVQKLLTVAPTPAPIDSPLVQHTDYKDTLRTIQEQMDMMTTPIGSRDIQSARFGEGSLQGADAEAAGRFVAELVGEGLGNTADQIAARTSEQESVVTGIDLNTEFLAGQHAMDNRSPLPRSRDQKLRVKVNGAIREVSIEKSRTGPNQLLDLPAGHKKRHTANEDANSMFSTPQRFDKIDGAQHKHSLSQVIHVDVTRSKQNHDAAANMNSARDGGLGDSSIPTVEAQCSYEEPLYPPNNAEVLLQLCEEIERLQFINKKRRQASSSMPLSAAEKVLLAQFDNIQPPEFIMRMLKSRKPWGKLSTRERLERNQERKNLIAIKDLYKKSEIANNYKRGDYGFTDSISASLEELDRVYASRRFVDNEIAMNSPALRHDLDALRALAVSDSGHVRDYEGIVASKRLDIDKMSHSLTRVQKATNSLIKTSRLRDSSLPQQSKLKAYEQYDPQLRENELTRYLAFIVARLADDLRTKKKLNINKRNSKIVEAAEGQELMSHTSLYFSKQPIKPDHAANARQNKKEYDRQREELRNHMIAMKERVRQARQRNREQYFENEKGAEERERLVTTNTYLFRELYFIEDASQLVNDLAEPEKLKEKIQQAQQQMQAQNGQYESGAGDIREEIRTADQVGRTNIVHVTDNSTLQGGVSHMSSRQFPGQQQQERVVATPSVQRVEEIEASAVSQMKTDDRTMSFAEQQMLQSLQEVTLDGLSKQEEPQQKQQVKPSAYLGSLYQNVIIQDLERQHQGVLIELEQAEEDLAKQAAEKDKLIAENVALKNRVKMYQTMIQEVEASQSIL